MTTELSDARYKTGPYLVGTPFPDPLAGIKLEHDEEKNDDPNVEIFAS
jgi:hypothetical protein